MENTWVCHFFKHKYMAVDLLTGVRFILTQDRINHTKCMKKLNTSLSHLPLTHGEFASIWLLLFSSNDDPLRWTKFQISADSASREHEPLYSFRCKDPVIFFFHINLTKSECDNFSHTAGIFPNPCLLQGHLSGKLALSLWAAVNYILLFYWTSAKNTVKK